jgi:UDP-N-acetylglucosamine transferase subunit ALG13
MAHTIQIKDHKQLSNGQLALLAECCGDPSTHSWLTCAAEVVLDDAKYQDAIDFHCQRVGLLHEAMRKAVAKAKATIGTLISVTPHSVRFVDHKQLSDGELALLVECCSDPSTHSWLRTAAEVVTDDEQYQNTINDHCQRVALLHESVKQAVTKAKATIGTKVSVTPSTSSANAASLQADNILKSLVGTVRQVDPPSLSVQ